MPHKQKPAPTPPENPRKWEDLGLSPAMLATLRRAKFEFPTDIQAELIPHALAGRDVLGQARTGTGKTAAFTLPMLERLEHGGGLQAIVLTPTRELAVQVDEHIRLLAVDTPFTTAAILGGRQIRAQVAALRRKPEIVIGTPGRVLDLMRRKELSFGSIKLAVLDEVDRMLDIGFRDDIRRILRTIETKHQTIFVSATLDDEIQKLARTFMHEPVVVNVSRDMLTVEGVDQCFITVHPLDKLAALVALLKNEAPSLAIVFTNTKHKARRVTQALKHEGVNCKEIHGDLDQARRERVMKAFRSQQLHVLVATDLASRGLDVIDISHIINYDIPEDASIYVHRIGRTARMGKSGRAITFVTREEGKLLTDVEKLINKQVLSYDPPWLVRREPRPEELVAAAAAAPTATAPEAESESSTPERYRQPRQRDELLDSLGLEPVNRTLGSRFRSRRKFRR
jgi:ATP-dependent RNA helicase DeaD